MAVFEKVCPPIRCRLRKSTYLCTLLATHASPMAQDTQFPHQVHKDSVYPKPVIFPAM